ncbi:ATP-binding protein [Haloarchaeobius sp. TZWSO28]|uniref:ATP-binding protein n=1 Tax=Haloarchaeobius sp. TZWSO28 TaxID=3446119 RepID=UPI003EBEBC6E
MADDSDDGGIAELPHNFRGRVGTIEGSPEKSALISLSTLDPDRALLEHCDNSIDAARVNERTSTTIDIIIGDDDSLEIQDDSGGIPEDSLNVWIALGSSRQASDEGYSLPDSIGWAGVGAIEAALSIGSRVILASRAHNADQGYGYIIDQEYLEKEGWDLDYYEYDDLDAGETVVRIEDLNVEISDLSGDYGSLAELLSTTYELYLSDTGEIPWAENVPEIDVDITIWDERAGEEIPVTPNVEFDWSYLPFDGAHPRAYHGLIIENEETDGPVQLDVICGLTRTKAPNPGVHLYANGRKIFDGETSYDAGFGFSNGLNQFRSERHGRLIIIALIRSLESPRDIPTENNKTTLRDGSDTTKEIKKRIGRTGLMYQHISDLHRTPTPITEPYPSEQRYAGHDGTLEHHYLNGETKITDHPGGDRDGRYYTLTELDEFKKTVKRHARLGISCLEVISNRHRPGYYGLQHDDIEPQSARSQYHETDGFLGDQFRKIWGRSDSRYLSEPVEIAKSDLPDQDIDLEIRLSTLEQLARMHAHRNQPVRYTGLKPWESPYYTEKLASFVGEDPENLQDEDSLLPDERYLYEQNRLPSEPEPDSSDNGEGDETEPNVDMRSMSLKEFTRSYESELASIDLEADSDYEKLGRVVTGYSYLTSLDELDSIQVSGETPEEKIESIIKKYAEIVGVTQQSN